MKNIMRKHQIYSGKNYLKFNLRYCSLVQIILIRIIPQRNNIDIFAEYLHIFV